MEKQSRGHQMIESLLVKPSQKPDFKNGLQALLSQSNVLMKAKAFMPEFVSSTDRMLNDPTQRKTMDIVIQAQEDQTLSSDQQFEQVHQPQPGFISMEIGVGVFDVLGQAPEEEEDQFQFHQQSTVPIVRIQSRQKSDSESSSSEDENLFMQFDDSSDESEKIKQNDVVSNSTSTSNKPMIMEMSSEVFSENKKTSQQMKFENLQRRTKF